MEDAPVFSCGPLDLLRLLVVWLLLVVRSRLLRRLRMRLRLWLGLPRLSRWCRTLWLTRRRSLRSGLRSFLTRRVHGTRVLRRLDRRRRTIDRWLRHRRTIILCRRWDWPVGRLVHRRLVHWSLVYRRLVHWRPICRRLIHRTFVLGRTVHGRLRHRGTIIPRWRFKGPIRRLIGRRLVSCRLIPHGLVPHRLVWLGPIWRYSGTIVRIPRLKSRTVHGLIRLCIRRLISRTVHRLIRL